MKLALNKCLIAIISFFLFVNCVMAQEATEQSALPDNAYKRTYGSGWECKRGFYKAGNQCVLIVIPDNAYLDAYGSKWRCSRGYLKRNKECVKILVPPNAYMVDAPFSKNGWQCERGYREIEDKERADGKACMKIKTPENGFLDELSYGAGWNCEQVPVGIVGSLIHACSLGPLESGPTRAFPARA